MKFKIGDHVRCTKDVGSNNTKNKVGHITDAESYGGTTSYRIKFVDPVGANPWWVIEEDLMPHSSVDFLE